MNFSSTDPIFQAVKLAQERGLLPTTLGSEQIQALTLRMKERVFFSARTANLQYLDALKKLVERHVRGEGRDNDLAQLRIEARKLLAQLGYTPEGGFPGDAELGIPPATAGSLRDLGSDKRLGLIFDTQAALARGLGMKLRNLARAEAFPSIELVRIKDARRLDWRRDWLARWKIAADNVDWVGVSRQAFDQGHMIALQSSPVWAALGSSALFPDALNVDYPPFAFNSGMGWRFVGFKESEQWGLSTAQPDAAAPAETPSLVGAYLDAPTSAAVPAAAADPARLARLKKLRAKFDAITAQRGF
jgi:hypothetical protein